MEKFEIDFTYRGNMYQADVSYKTTEKINFRVSGFRPADLNIPPIISVIRLDNGDYHFIETDKDASELEGNIWRSIVEQCEQNGIKIL